MKCQDIENLLDNCGATDLTPAQQEGVGDHLSSCESCKSAWRSAQALRDWSGTPTPQPRAELFEESMRLAVSTSSNHRLRHGPFWLGTAVGGALAASIVAAVLGFNSTIPDTPDTVPVLTMALHDNRDISVAIDSAEALVGAQIRVVLTGGVELNGFEGRSAISWTTNLTAGINRLTLPVRAITTDGGQVLVEVEHDSKRRLFLVQVDVDIDDEELGAVPADKGLESLIAGARPGLQPDFVKFTEPKIHSDV